MTITTEAEEFTRLARLWSETFVSAIRSLAAERDALQAENARMRKLAAYLAGTNTDHVQVALAGNPIVCDAIYAEARAALGETQ